MLIINTLIVVALFVALTKLAHKITEEWTLPIWLLHKPFNCFLCCSFWLNMIAATVYGVQTQQFIPTIVWVLLTVLHTIGLIKKEEEEMK